MAELSKAFDRPLTFGDADQVRVIRIMNGDQAYCLRCYKEYDPLLFSRGAKCRTCYVKLEPGAACAVSGWRSAGVT
jgi:hypothetical protein